MAVYFNGTVTTVSDSGYNIGLFQYTLLNDESLKITFNGTPYNCPKIDAFGCYFYGGFTEEGPDFTTYPFAIRCDYNSEENIIFTENDGTHTLKVETPCINRVVFGEDVLIDLSSDTVTSSDHIMNGYIGHLADGSTVTGTGSGGTDGNNLEYGITDGTLPVVGVGQIGYAEL